MARGIVTVLNFDEHGLDGLTLWLSVISNKNLHAMLSPTQPSPL
jgi:hypothetical protein